MKQGSLIYDVETGRMDVRFGLDEYDGGLHCGVTMEAKVGNMYRNGG